MDDLNILKIFINCDSKIITKKLSQKWLASNIDVKTYLDTRYLDSLSYAETIYRIVHNVDVRPVCLHCGNSVLFVSFSHGFRKYCSNRCLTSSKLVIEQRKLTNIKKYGVVTPLQNEQIKLLIKEALINKYGVDNVFKSEYIKEKIKNTNIERYNAPNVLSKESILYEKILESIISKYNGHPMLNEDVILKRKNTCQERYSCDYIFQTDMFKNKSMATKFIKYGDPFFTNREKAEETYLAKYNVKNPVQSEEIKEKIKLTNNYRYNVNFPMQNENILQKTKLTNIEKYGVGNPALSEIVKEKIRLTNINKYGVVCPLQNEYIKLKSIETCITKYDVLSFSSTNLFKMTQSLLMQSREMQLHINNVKKQNNTFNSSKIEQQFKIFLEQNYKDDFEYQYRSNKYPFSCDFYIKSLDLYIEIQGSWTHGGKPFDINNLADQKQLANWQSKNSTYYLNAIKTWTIRDVNKRKIAEENHLNYLEIFSNKIEIVILIFQDFLH